MSVDVVHSRRCCRVTPECGLEYWVRLSDGRPFLYCDECSMSYWGLHAIDDHFFHGSDAWEDRPATRAEVVEWGFEADIAWVG